MLQGWGLEGWGLELADLIVQLQLVELQLMLPPGGINPPREFLGSPPLEQLIAQNSLEAIRSIKLSLIDLPSG